MGVPRAVRIVSKSERGIAGLNFKLKSVWKKLGVQMEKSKLDAFEKTIECLLRIEKIVNDTENISNLLDDLEDVIAHTRVVLEIHPCLGPECFCRMVEIQSKSLEAAIVERLKEL